MARHQRFSIGRFTLLVASQFLLLCLAFRFWAPAFWSRQVMAGPGPFILVFLGTHLFNCFFEWGFHRYVLHGAVHPWLIRFSRGHRHHHALTPIQLRPSEVGDGRIVLNRYPITQDEQHEDAAFPPYALLAFWLLYSPLLLVTQLLLPQVPILLGGYTAIAWSMVAYEVFHAIEHYPYEWWEAATRHPRWGWLWRRVYGFHHFHHANIGWNEAISGFFGLPVADWVFLTYHQPKDLLLEGRVATIKDFRPSSWRWPFIDWLDHWARQREAKIIHKATPSA